MVSVSSMPAENVSVSALLSPWRSMRADKAAADIDRSVKSWFPKGSAGVGPVITPVCHPFGATAPVPEKQGMENVIFGKYSPNNGYSAVLSFYLILRKKC